MRLDWAMLCTAAEGRDGLAYILGGGWDTTSRAEFPSAFVGAIAVRLLFRPEEAGAHRLLLTGRDETEQAIADPVEVPFTVEPPANLPEGWDANSLICATLHGLPLPAAGMYAFDIEVDGIHVKRLPFRVTSTSPAPPDAPKPGGPEEAQ